jgi:ABC-type Fe3+-hydroxamate transport system substrate-binding protein
MTRANRLVCGAVIVWAVTCGSSAPITRGLAAEEARELRDALGRRVRVPAAPRQVVSLAPSITETIYGLGAGATIAGITDFTDWPPEARDLTSVGGVVNPSVEKIIALRPDLVIATREINRKETVDDLDRLGVSVFVVNPQGLDGTLESIRQIGAALNRTSEADQLVARLRARRAAVAARVKDLPRPRVLLVIYPDPVFTIGRGAFITEVIEAAGARSVTDDLPQSWPQISLEEVLRRNPDFLLLPLNGHTSLSAADLQRRPGWDRLEAVRHNRVLYYDERLDHSSPRAFDALEDLARKFHPEAFARP